MNSKNMKEWTVDEEKSIALTVPFLREYGACFGGAGVAEESMEMVPFLPLG